MPKKTQPVPDGSYAEIDAYVRRMKANADYAERRFFRRADRMVKLAKVDHTTRGGRSLDEFTDKESDLIKVPYPYANSRQILAEIMPQDDPDPVVTSLKRYLSKEDFSSDIYWEKYLSDPTAYSSSDAATMMKAAVQYVGRRSPLYREWRKSVLDAIVTGLGCMQIVAQKKTTFPTYKRVLYRDLVLDWTNISHPDESGFVAVKRVRPLDEIREDASFTADRSLVNSCTLDASVYGVNDIEYGCYWEVYDRVKDQFCVIPDGQRFWLSKPEKLSELYPFKVDDDGHDCDWPFSFLVNEDILDEPWGLGDIYPIESAVRATDKVRQAEVNHFKRFVRKYVTASGALNAQGKRDLKNPADGTVIELQSGQSTESAVVPLMDAPMSGDVWRVEEALSHDIQVTQPIGPNSLVHGVGTQPDTLGQSQIIEQNANNRLGEKQAKAMQMLGKMYRFTGQYVQKYWTDETWIHVSGDGSDDKDWLRFDPVKAQGEFSFDVEPESMKDNTALYRAQIAQAIETTAPLLPQAAQVPGLAFLLRKYYDQFETLAQESDKIIPDEWINPPQPAPGAPGQPGGMPAQPGQQPPQGPGPSAAPNPLASQPPNGIAGVSPQLVQMIQQNGPQAVLDSINKLPENQRQAILQHLQQAGFGQPQGQQPQPQPVAAPQ